MGLDDRDYMRERARRRDIAENARSNGSGWGKSPTSSKSSMRGAGWGPSLWLASVAAAFYCGVLFQSSHADSSRRIIGSAPAGAGSSDVHHPLERFTGALSGTFGIETSPAVSFPENGSLHLYGPPVDGGAELIIVSNKLQPEMNYFVRASDWLQGRRYWIYLFKEAVMRLRHRCPSVHTELPTLKVKPGMASRSFLDEE